jgi:methanogenic corrinoid protein MtbC1
VSEVFFQQLSLSLIDGDIENVESVVSQAVDQGPDAYACLLHAWAVGIKNLGSLVAGGENLLSELFRSAGAIETALYIHEPFLTGLYRNLIGTLLTRDLPGTQNIPYLQWLSQSGVLLENRS